MTSGALRFWGTVEAQTNAVDSSGGQTVAWQRVGDWILDLEPVAAGESWDETRRNAAQVTHKGKGRWIPGVGPKCRFVVGEGSDRRIFAIIAAYDVDGRRREMNVLMAEEIGGPSIAG